MISSKSSHNFFIKMLKESMRKSCIIPIVAFVIAFLDLSSDAFDYRYHLPESQLFYLGQADLSFLVNILIIAAGAITAILLFGFQWSKKQCNLIYSLGLKRADIFNAKFWGGILPMVGSAVAIYIYGILANLIAKNTFVPHYFLQSFYVTALLLGIFIFTFALCSVVFSNTGNVVEAGVFALILFLSPFALEEFISACKAEYTLGGDNSGFTYNWEWSTPFLNNWAFYWFSGTEDTLVSKNNFSYYIDIDFWSFTTTISAIIYSVILYFIGLFSFKKHKVENAGTWCKNNGIIEAATVVISISVFFAVLSISTENDILGNASIWTFVMCCICCLILTVIFKLIFSSKHKDAVKKSFIRFPIYVACFGIVTLIFATGLFGYSSYVPSNDEILSVEVSASVFMYDNDTNNIGYNNCGLCEMDTIKDHFLLAYTGDYYIDENIHLSVNQNSYYFVDSEDIDEVVKLHKSIIADGKIKDNSENACGLPISFTYKLRNGQEITRIYFETTDETAKKIYKLNDLKCSKKYRSGIVNDTDTLANQLVGILGYEPKISGNNVYDLNGNQVGSLNLNDGSSVDVFFYDYATQTEYYVCEAQSRMDFIDMYACFLYSKDMSRGYCIGMADEELVNAIRTDITNQSSDDYFFHSAEDEIGVISFGLAENEQSALVVSDYETYSEILSDDGYANDFDWYVGITYVTNFTLTKNMTNTVKYLEAHDLMKYLEANPKTSDIKYVKLATPAELYKHNSSTESQTLPLFCAAYVNTESSYNISEENHHLFAYIEDKIYDDETIEKLIDGSVCFGYCGKDYHIMEITYEDGAYETLLIQPEAYESIVG